MGERQAQVQRRDKKLLLRRLRKPLLVPVPCGYSSLIGSQVRSAISHVLAILSLRTPHVQPDHSRGAKGCLPASIEFSSLCPSWVSASFLAGSSKCREFDAIGCETGQLDKFAASCYNKS